MAAIRATTVLALCALALFALVGGAEAKTFNVTWAARSTSSLVIPKLSVQCGDSVNFRVAANSTYSVVRVTPASAAQRRLPGVCSANVSKVEFAAKRVTVATSYKLTYSAKGLYYYISNGTQCTRGKTALLVNVTNDCPKPSPKPSPPVPSPPAKPAAKNITQAWTFGVGPVTVQANCGDSVIFQSSGGAPHDVVEVSSNSCTASQVKEWQPVSAQAFMSAPVVLNTTGLRTFICTVGSHCAGGVIVSYNVVC